MMHIIQDVFVLNNLRVLNEGLGGSKMIIEGTFQRADEVNNNKRTYPKKILAESVDKLQPSISERMLVGEIDHPEYETVKLSKASHLITGLRMEGTEVVGRAEILSTPAGQVVKSLINDGVKIGISSRGVGSLSENSDGTKTVNEDYKCLTYDIVADPSTRGAFPGLSESTKVQSIVKSTMKKTLGEKVFVQMLKSKLNEGSYTSMPSKWGSRVALADKKKRQAKKRPQEGLARALAKPRKSGEPVATVAPAEEELRSQNASFDIAAIVKGLNRLSEAKKKKQGILGRVVSKIRGGKSKPFLPISKGFTVGDTEVKGTLPKGRRSTDIDDPAHAAEHGNPPKKDQPKKIADIRGGDFGIKAP